MPSLRSNHSSAQVGGVEEDRASSVQLADKGILSPVSGLEGARGGGKSEEPVSACDIGVASAIHAMAEARLYSPGMWNRPAPSQRRSAS